MYLSYFGLRRPPFRITPDPDFFFPGGNRGAVLEALRYAVTEGEGIVKVVGEVGSGKTMLLRMLARELPDSCTLAYLANPNLSPDEIVRALAHELGLDVPGGLARTSLMLELNEYLLGEYRSGRRVVLFVEEAQNTPLETLEEIRLLSNLETSRDKLLQIVLFGQPELDEKIHSHAMRQLAERITHGFDLPPLTAREVGDYLTARLHASGYRGNGLFTPRAVRAITGYSRGLLRRINVLADKALLAAFAATAKGVTAKHVRQAAADSEFGPLTRRRRRGFGFGVAGVAALALAAGAAVLWLRPVDPSRAPDPGVSGVEPRRQTVTVGIGAPPDAAAATHWTLADARRAGDVAPGTGVSDGAAPEGFGRLEAVAPALGQEVTVDILSRLPLPDADGGID